MRKTLAFTIVGSLLLGASGCTTPLKRGFKEFKGASSKAKVIPGTLTNALSQCRGVRIGRPRSDLGGLVDSRFAGALTRALHEALTKGDEPVFPGGSPTLEIDPEITWFHKSGVLGGIVGSDSYAVVLFWLSADGAPAGRVQVVTKEAASRTGATDVAKSMAKELARFFDKLGEDQD
jgi:hypothetical protein